MSRRSRRLIRSKQPSPKAAKISTFSRVPKVLGVGLLVTAVLTAAAAISSPAQTLQAVAFTASLPAGIKLTTAHLQVIELPKATQLDNYQIAITELLGRELLYPVSAKSLATRSNVLGAISALQELTLSFDQKSLPAQVNSGDVFDLWVIPQDAVGNAIGEAQLVITQLPVALIVEQNLNSSAEVPITFFVLPSQIAPVLNAIATGKPYLARR